MHPLEWESRHIEKMPFKDDGFVTGSIILPGLEMPLTLWGKHYFKFDGVVPDMWEYLRSLSTDMRFYLDKYIGDPRYEAGFNTGIGWYEYLGMFMAVKDISPKVNLSNTAHEAAEIAFRLGYRRELENHLKQFGLKKGLTGLESHEVGVVSSILIPRSKGMDVMGLYREQDPNTYRDLLIKGYL